VRERDNKQVFRDYCLDVARVGGDEVLQELGVVTVRGRGEIDVLEQVVADDADEEERSGDEAGGGRPVLTPPQSSEPPELVDLRRHGQHLPTTLQKTKAAGHW